MSFVNKLTPTRRLIIVTCLTCIPLFVYAFLLSMNRYNMVVESRWSGMRTAESAIEVSFMSTVRSQQISVKSITDKKALREFTQADFSVINEDFIVANNEISDLVRHMGSFLSDSVCCIFVDNKSLQGIANFRHGVELALESDWFDEAALYNGKFMVGYGDLNNSGKNYIICYGVIYSPDYPFDLSMVVAIGFPETGFFNTVSNMLQGEEMLLISPNGVIASSSIRALVGSDEEAVIRTGSNRLALDGENWLYLTKPLENNYWGLHGWKLYILSPASEVANTAAEAIIPMVLLAGVLLAIIAVFHRVILKSMDIERKEAVVRSLQSQIDPHYFYNTLESIRMKLLLAGDEEHSEMIQYFAESLRNYRKIDGDLIPLKDEVEFLERFLKLQKIRLGDKISYHIEAAESTLEYYVPHMLIQPVLENAVYHGIEKLEGKGSVILEFAELDGWLHILVTDNGIGMAEDELAALLEKLNKNDYAIGKSLGLINVSRRIHLLYGDGSTMKIRSKHGFGTEVEIFLEVKKPYGAQPADS